MYFYFMSNRQLDAIMTNNLYNSDSDDIQFGGSSSKPSGGFPPIYLCKKEDIIVDKKEKDREYQDKKDSVSSIKKIMERRGNVKPFI